MSSSVQPIFIVLKGKTGSGKTAVLQHLSSSGYPVIDIEAIAKHRGSVFGGIGIDGIQPTQQVFEQEISELYQTFSAKSFVFTEYEAGSVGKRKIPEWFYRKMKEGLQVELFVSKQQRIDNITKAYFSGEVNDNDFLLATDKLSERTPEEKIFFLKEMIKAKKYTLFVEEILSYYDQSLQYNNSTVAFIETFCGENFNAASIADDIIQSLHEKGITLIS